MSGSNGYLPRRLYGMAVVGILVVQSSVVGHVRIDSPNGGENYVAGETVQIEWHVVIPHGTQNWDLWYSNSGPEGPWIDVAVDLPPGDTGFDAVHVFDWFVPEDATTEARIRVRQDNQEFDYFDFSDSNFTIEVPALVPCDGDGDSDVDLLDFGLFQLCFGKSDVSPDCEPFDTDLDNEVDLEDFEVFLMVFTGPGD